MGAETDTDDGRRRRENDVTPRRCIARCINSGGCTAVRHIQREGNPGQPDDGADRPAVAVRSVQGDRGDDGEAGQQIDDERIELPYFVQPDRVGRVAQRHPRHAHADDGNEREGYEDDGEPDQ